MPLLLHVARRRVVDDGVAETWSIASASEMLLAALPDDQRGLALPVDLGRDVRIERNRSVRLISRCVPFVKKPGCCGYDMSCCRCAPPGRPRSARDGPSCRRRRCAPARAARGRWTSVTFRPPLPAANARCAGFQTARTGGDQRGHAGDVDVGDALVREQYRDARCRAIALDVGEQPQPTGLRMRPRRSPVQRQRCARGNDARADEKLAARRFQRFPSV